jgi:phage terminase small subunit
MAEPKDLTPKQARFVEEYLIDLNATQAATRAGYSPRSAEVEGCRLLKNAKVAVMVQTAIAERSARTEITADRVLKELAKLGFADLRKAVIWRANVTGMVEGDDGAQRLAVTNEVQLIDSDKLDDDTAAAISEVGQDSRGGLKIKMHDKRGALESIGRHLGMFTDKVEHSGRIAVSDGVDRPPKETRDEWVKRHGTAVGVGAAAGAAARRD